jgi:conjugative transposon TraK protein
MRNIDTAFRYMRDFTIAVVVGCTLLCAAVLYQSFRMVRSMQNRIYVLAQGKALEAFASDREENIAVEARDHVKTFHRLFFTLDPDDQVITANMTRALYLADGSAKRQYDDLRESGYYASLISGNISQRITVDSVTVDTARYPYYFRCYATETLTRTTATVTRRLVTEGYLRNVSRSDHNPHGFLIERWRILENKNIKTVHQPPQENIAH